MVSNSCMVFSIGCIDLPRRFAVPFAFASCLGLAARGLQHHVRLRLISALLDRLTHKYTLASVSDVSQSLITFSGECRASGTCCGDCNHGERGCDCCPFGGLVRLFHLRYK